MSTVLELNAAKTSLAANGQYRSLAVLPTDDNKIVTSVDMKNTTTYTIAAQPDVPSILSFNVTATDTADTMGTLAVVGTLYGAAQSETITPIAGQTVLSTKMYDGATTIIGTGWAVDAVEGTKDKLIVGVAGVMAPAGYYISALDILATAVVGAQTAVTGASVADLTKFTGLVAGHTYGTKLTYVALTSGEAIAYLSPL